MSNNSESDGNNKIANKTDVELNNMYGHYFVYPENIDAVFQTPDTKLHITFTSRTIFDTTNKEMYTKENKFRSVYYRLPNLRLSEFFDIDTIRPDVVPARKKEIAEIREVTDMILSDADKVTDIHTKKRMLYYVKCLANATKGCAFSDDIAMSVAKVAVRNNLASVADMALLKNKKDLQTAKVSEGKRTNIGR